MQIFLSFDELELKSSPYRFVLKRVIVLNVVDQFLEQITAVVDLKQSCILLVIGVDWSYLLLGVTDTSNWLLHDYVWAALNVVLRVEQVIGWRLDFLIKFEHLDNVGLLAITGSSLMLMVHVTILVLFISKQVVLGLVWVSCVDFVTLLLMSAWNPIFVDVTGCHRYVHMLLARFLMRISHNHFDSLKVFSGCTNSLHKLQVFTLHILMTFRKLIVLESKLQDFLAGRPLCLSGLFPVLLVHIESGFVFSCRRCHTSVILMDWLDILLVWFRLFLLVCPQVLYLYLVFVFTHAEVTYLGVQVLDLSSIALRRMTFFLQLSFKGFFLFPKSTFQRGDLLFKVFNLSCMHLFAFVVLHLFGLNLWQFVLHLFALGDWYF